MIKEMKLMKCDVTFGTALDIIQQDPTSTLGMRLPAWKSDVVIRVQHPDTNSKMTHPYLYVQSRFGCVPWKETVVEMFSDDWQVVEIVDEGTIADICKHDEVKTEKVKTEKKECTCKECKCDSIKFVEEPCIPGIAQVIYDLYLHLHDEEE